MTRSVSSRRDFIRTMGDAAAALSTAGLWSCVTSRKRPNIVLIMADDMGFSDIGCYGGEIATPHLDSLAAGGLRFSQFYNGARCCPTRASLLTGLYAHQTGIGDMTGGDRGVSGYRGDLNRECVTIAEVLKAAGYKTYISGKWHVTDATKPGNPKDNWPLQRGFDCFYGTITGAGSFFDPESLSRGNAFLETPDGDFYYTDAITENAERFIQDHEASHKDTPFFLYASYTAPHWPLHALEEDIAKYEGRFDRGWDVLRRERYDRMVGMGLILPAWDLSARHDRVFSWEDAPDKAWQVRRMMVYAAMVDRLDRGIGRIIRTLKETGRFQNTLVLFLSDNGGCHEELTPSWLNFLLNDPVAKAETRDGRPVRLLNNPEVMPGGEDTYQSYGYPWANLSNTPFRLFKHWVHEGGIASPLIVHWPERIKRGGGIRTQVGHIIDIMPTCVEAAGAEYPKAYRGEGILPPEGMSLLAAMEAGTERERTLFWEHEGSRAVRQGKWKLVARSELRAWELYDLDADRTETRDLAADDLRRVKELAGLWKNWAHRARVLPNSPPPTPDEETARSVLAEKTGWTVLEGLWSFHDGAFSQTSGKANCRIFGPESFWTDFVFEVEAKKTGGREGFLIFFRASDQGPGYRWNIGGWGNARHGLQGGEDVHFSDGSIETDRWYKIKVEVSGASIRCRLDGRLVHDVTDSMHRAGGIGLGTWMTQAEFRSIRVTDPTGAVLYER